MDNPIVQIRDSCIPWAGKGLFAKQCFKAGMLVAEFDGGVYLKKDLPKEYNGSIISFNDNTAMYCNKDCLASYANDCIDFPELSLAVQTGMFVADIGTKKIRRNLLRTLQRKRPFYRKCAEVKLNVEIFLWERPQGNRAFLRAIADIKANEEICCHYGFPYWYEKEAVFIGFSDENTLKTELPKDITVFPAFRHYIETFYPQAESWFKLPDQSDQYTTVVIKHRKSSEGYIFNIPDVRKIIQPMKW